MSARFICSKISLRRSPFDEVVSASASNMYSGELGSVTLFITSYISHTLITLTGR